VRPPRVTPGVSQTRNDMSDWLFRDPENTAVFTTRQVVDDGAPILRVSHDADDDSWQFHAAGTPRLADARILALREVIDLDPSVAALADLPPGWVAVRASPHTPWVRQKKDLAFDEQAG